MSYIEREALLEHKRKMKGFDLSIEYWSEAVLCEDIRNAPAADVVEVVRCKNCKHWHKCLSDDGSVEYIHFSRCTKGNQLANGNDYFCSSGERNID